MEESLVAPCGMNCAVCSAYLAKTHNVKDAGIRYPYCPGCRPRHKTCAFLKKRCTRLLNGKVRFCFECPDFPCENLLKLDRRYRNRYHMSMVDNLTAIKQKGITRFLAQEEEKWRCPRCGDTICCHNGLCFSCQQPQLKKQTFRYRWNLDEKK